jgi:hypothetical protein
VTNLRPTGLGRWPIILGYQNTELVATIEGETGNINIIEGPAATPLRVNDSLLLHKGISPQSISPKLWTNIPNSVKQRILSQVVSAETRLAEQWRQYSNEEALTGAFFSQINNSFAEQGWTISISFVEFSKQVKENKTGTDIAVIIDALSNEKQRSFKTLWLQAKTSEGTPTATSTYPDLAEQLKTAQNYCEASFGIVYTPNGVFVLGTQEPTAPIFSSVLESSMQCHVGDTRIEVLKNSLNRKRLFLITATEEAG